MNLNDTLTGICNSALAMIGDNRFISDIEDSNNPLCVTFQTVLYQVCREVQAHEYGVWDELETDVDLVLRRQTEAGGAFNGVFQYNLPLHMIAPVECYISGRGRIPYEISGGYLHCRESSGVRLRYIKFSLNPSEWGVELRTCVIKLLAARLVASIVKDYSSSQKLEQQFWSYDYVHWAGNKKNKSKRINLPGDDSMLTRNYPSNGEPVPVVRDIY